MFPKITAADVMSIVLFHVSTARNCRMEVILVKKYLSSGNRVDIQWILAIENISGLGYTNGDIFDLSLTRVLYSYDMNPEVK